MKTFRFEALDADGQLVNGRLASDSSKEALTELLARGLTVQRMIQVREREPGTPVSTPPPSAPTREQPVTPARPDPLWSVRIRTLAQRLAAGIRDTVHSAPERRILVACLILVGLGLLLVAWSGESRARSAGVLEPEETRVQLTGRLLARHGARLDLAGVQVAFRYPDVPMDDFRSPEQLHLDASGRFTYTCRFRSRRPPRFLILAAYRGGRPVSEELRIGLGASGGTIETPPLEVGGP